MARLSKNKSKRRLGYSEMLNRFHSQIEKIRQNEEFFGGVGISLEQREDGTGTITRRGVNEQTLKLFLLDFRPLFMESSQLQFSRIANQIARNNEDGVVRRQVKGAQDVWNKILQNKPGATSSSGITYQINDEELTTDLNIRKWLTEEYFHPDDDLGLSVVKSSPVFEGLSKFSLIMSLQNLGKLIVWFDEHLVQKEIKRIQEGEL